MSHQDIIGTSELITSLLNRTTHPGSHPSRKVHRKEPAATPPLLWPPWNRENVNDLGCRSPHIRFELQEADIRGVIVSQRRL